MKQDSTVRARAGARFEEMYQQLNPEQRRAVDTIEGTVMVLAGPGTGKTQLLAMRIANILQRTQMDPWNILCVTFTESGVAAMRERLRAIIGEAAYYVRVHTFHSFCNEIIQEHQELFSNRRESRPLSDIERIELFETLLDKLPATSPLKVFGQPYFYLRDISANIQSLKQEHISPEQFGVVLGQLKKFITKGEESATTFFAVKPSERTATACAAIHTYLMNVAAEVELPEGMQQGLRSAWEAFESVAHDSTDKRGASKARTAYKNQLQRWFTRMVRDGKNNEALVAVYRQYEEQLEKRGRYDYEDMINHVIEAFGNNSDLLADYQEQFQYILVDEYQDTNGAQNEVVRLLGSFDDRPNICVVGDDKQSIYRFQGASLANMLDFYERYREHVAIVSLVDNYRSQPTVLAAADALIGHNEESLPKYIPGTTSLLTPQAGRLAEPFTVFESPSADVEDYHLAKHIESMVAAGVAPEDIAVIVRYHRDSQGIFGYLRQLGVPVRLEGGEDAFRVRAVQQFLTLLECITDVRRDDLLADVLHAEWLSLPGLDVLKVVRYTGVHRLSLWSVIVDEQQLTAAGISETAPWLAFVHHVADWRIRHHNTSLQAFLSEVIEESGLLDYMLRPTTAPGVLQALRRVLDEAKALNEAQHTVSLPDFLQAVRRVERHDIALMTQPWQVSENAVRVMTAHKAKGLEFEHVFLLRVCDKHWGNNPTPVRLALPLGLVRRDPVLGGENNEDERRLFYVAVTRARQSVTLSFARHNELGRPTVPSLFLQELPSELLARHRVEEEFMAGQQRLADSLRPPVVAATDDVTAWVKAQMERYTMSVTHLNNYLTCPRMFYVRNVLQVPAVRTVHQALGTAVHGALADWLARYQKDEKGPAVTVLLTSFERHLAREVLTAREAQEVEEVGREILTAYFVHYATSFNPRAVSEFDFTPHGVRVGSAAITGKVDKIEWLDEERKTVNVVDYKTGQPDGKTSALKAGGDYHRQLVFYKLLCDASPRFPYEMVSGEIDFVQKSRRGQFVKKRIVVSEADTKELTATIERVWQEIMNLRFMEPATWCGECEYCQL